MSEPEQADEDQASEDHYSCRVNRLVFHVNPDEPSESGEGKHKGHDSTRSRILRPEAQRTKHKEADR